MFFCRWRTACRKRLTWCGYPWAAPGSDSEKQARKLADAGFRVEWTTDAPLAC